MAKYGIPIPAPEQPEEPEQTGPQDTPTVTPAPTPASRVVSVMDLNLTQLFEYKKEDRK